MSQKTPANLAESVAQRLRNIARQRGENIQLVLVRYATERLLYRLSQDPASERFVLKGAVLFYVWDGTPHRPTRDVDFLGYGDSSPEALATTFRAVCSRLVEPDGMTFVADSVTAQPIRQEQEYGGIRVKVLAMLGNAQIPLQIDVGFGDAVTPDPEYVVFPPLLDFPAPRIRIYPVATVVAEKLEAMVKLGIANSRMKDYYDLWILAGTQRIEGEMLTQAITTTFERRGTAIPDTIPLGLSETFAQDPQKQTQWNAFLTRTTLTPTPPALPEVVSRLQAFVHPAMRAARGHEDFHRVWILATGWREP